MAQQHTKGINQFARMHEISVIPRQLSAILFA